ncbi:MAG TPA: hypothetical protein PLB18_24725 [Acidobacteriota bacterium]|nr:hypothetical protein [Acidobacteriota bacterium]HND22596.1 hypothetical protein [Acidobacteriota bacterium]
MLKDAVGWTLHDAIELISPLGMSQEARPKTFRHAIFGESAKMLQVTSDGWILAGGRLNLKYSRIQSIVADVATLMVYPTASPELLPIFASEWVVVGERAHVLVLDVEFAGQQPHLKAQLTPVFQPLAERFGPRFEAIAERPGWFQEIAEPWAIFASGFVSVLVDVREAFNTYLQATIQSAYLPNLSQAKAGEDHPDVIHYKHHHYIHSPGIPMIQPKAGEAWTHEFMRDWHFGPPRFPDLPEIFA